MSDAIMAALMAVATFLALHLGVYLTNTLY
jgi:hypothetical protein